MLKFVVLSGQTVTSRRHQKMGPARRESSAMAGPAALADKQREWLCEAISLVSNVDQWINLWDVV